MSRKEILGIWVMTFAIFLLAVVSLALSPMWVAVFLIRPSLMNPISNTISKNIMKQFMKGIMVNDGKHTKLRGVPSEAGE